MRKAVTGFGVLLIGGTLSCQALAADWEQMGDEFFSGASSDVYLGMNSKFREKYYTKDGNGDPLNDYENNGEAQLTMGVNFISGYIGDTFGLDLSALSRSELYSETATGYSLYNYGMKILKQTDCYYYGNSNQYRCDGFSGASGITQINFKMKAGEGDERLNFNTGLGFYNGGLISSSDEDDVIPTSYTGFELDGRWGNTRLDYVFVNGVMSNDDSGVQDIMAMPNYASHYDYSQPEDIEKRKIDFVHSIGLNQKIGGLNLVLAAADARDYLRRYHARTDYTLKFNKRDNLMFRAQYYRNHQYGSVWEWEKTEGYPSKYANQPDQTELMNYTVAWTLSPWTIAFHHTRIGDGGFSYGFGNVKGVLKNDTAGNYGSMRRPNGQVWAVENTMDFRYSRNKWLKGLKFTYGYHRSNYHSDNVRDGETSIIGDTHEDEHAITASYLFRHGTLKGLSFNFKQAFYDDKGHKQNEGKINDTKFDIAYSFPLK